MVPAIWDHFAASRCWYRRGKWIAALQTLLAVPLPIAIAIYVRALPLNNQTRALAVFCGLTASLIDVVVLDRLQRHFRLHGAKEQEMFDTMLMHLEWPALRAGKKPGPQDTVVASRRAPKRDRRPRDWYPQVVGKVALEEARFLCQSLNSWWDRELRRRYAAALLCSTILIIIGVFWIGWRGGMTLPDLVATVYAPVAPLIMWTVREWSRHVDAVNLSDRIQAYVETLWDRVVQSEITSEKMSSEARVVQDSIFDRRRSAPFVPNLLQRIQQRGYAHTAVEGANDMAERLTERRRREK